ncbi:MAG: ABC transporter substrate-binding protein [Deltaproteobacteria bacterium]|nr:ABC transporter substrate-binding protein [Deltaproteobacteria bacterium]
MKPSVAKGKVWLGLTVLALTLCLGAPGAQAADTVKIGSIVPLSGGLALEGRETFRGIEIAADMQNARGGVHDKQIALVKGDSQTPKTAITEAERLINVEGVKLFCGHYSSSRTKAATTITEKYGAVTMVVIALADDITSRGFKFVFQAPGRASMWGGDAAKFIAEAAAPKLGIKPAELTVALAHEDSDFGTSISEGFITVAKQFGMKIVAREPYSYKALDLSSVVLRLKQANADVLVLTPYIRDGVLFLQQARDAQLNPKVLICPGGVLSNPVFHEKLGEDMNYILVTSSASLNVKEEAFQKEGWEALKEFEKRYQEKFNEPATQDAYQGFDGAWVFFHYALPQAKSLEPQDVADCLRGLKLAQGQSVTTFGYEFGGLDNPNPGANLIGWPNIFQWQQGSIRHMVHPAKFAGSELMLPMPAWGQRSMK